jgi:hypothetical protein
MFSIYQYYFKIKAINVKINILLLYFYILEEIKYKKRETNI